MKQIRKISNLVADELQASLDAKGIKLDEDVFEGKVSSIVSMIAESVDAEDKAEDADVEEEDDEITEDDKFYIATGAAKVGDADVAEGEFVEVSDEDGELKATVYDADGNVKNEAFKVTEDDIKAFSANADEIEVEDEVDDDDDDVEEGFKKRTQGEKKALAKRDKKNSKKRDRKEQKAGYIRRKQANGSYKLEKMTSAEKQARKKIGKKLGKKFGGANAGSTSGTVTEGFDISANGMKIALNEGDEITVDEDVITVVREGATFISGLKVSENFLQRCISEGVIAEAKCDEDEDECEECGDAKVAEEDEKEEEVKEGKKKCVKEDDEDTSDDDEDEDEDAEESDDDKDEDEEVDEAVVLTFKSNKGYVLVREGAELPMGNRVRARATLATNGYNVTSEILDRASRGELVTL